MSLPEFPTINPPLTRDDAINQIISSIAMEELALSHIINAEGEKLQYILGTIPGSTGPQPTIEQVLDVNESVRAVLQSAAETQTALRSKLQTALSASTMRGPTGPTGPTGPQGETEVSAFRASMIDAPSIVDVDDPFIFNVIDFDEHPDITYDSTTGVFTINNSGEFDFYVISWWFYSDGYGGPFPYSVTLNVDNAPYATLTIPFSEAQISNSEVIPTDAVPRTFYLSNTSDEAIGLPGTGSQAKITILGYKSPD